MAKPRVEPSFVAKIRFLSPEDGGRKDPVFQGYKPDLIYERSDEDETSMIWPLYVDLEGKRYPDGYPIPQVCCAEMYMINKALKGRSRIQEGLEFTLVEEGAHAVGYGVVTKVNG